MLHNIHRLVANLYSAVLLVYTLFLVSYPLTAVAENDATRVNQNSKVAK